VKKIKNVLIWLIIFILWVWLAFASWIFNKEWKNWDANVSPNALWDNANDIWKISWSIDIEDSTTSEYDSWLRWAIDNYSINSDLFWNFNSTTWSSKLRFYDDPTLVSDASKCWADSLEAYKFQTWLYINSVSWWRLLLDTSQSYICSNQYVNIVFKSDHIADKKIGDWTFSLIDVFWKQQINVNWVINLNWEDWEWILSRWDQEVLNLDTDFSRKALLKRDIDKNISDIYFTNSLDVKDNDYSISTINNTSDKDKYYLYDYSWQEKVGSDKVTYDSQEYINQWKDLTIWNDWEWVTSINWKNTIIVKWWNIYIKSNLDNTNDSKDLLILIAKRDKVSWNWWNIYINPDVTNIDAVLVSDWSLLSYRGWLIQWPWFNVDNIRKQLLIYGSVMTSNNIWKEDIPYWADYYEKDFWSIITNNEMIDNIYDLWNIRTFNVKYWESPLEADKLVPIDWTSWFLQNAWAWKCEWYNWENCDSDLRKSTKSNPLIIEYNTNIVKINPFIIKK